MQPTKVGNTAAETTTKAVCAEAKIATEIAFTGPVLAGSDVVAEVTSTVAEVVAEAPRCVRNPYRVPRPAAAAAMAEVALAAATETIEVARTPRMCAGACAGYLS